MNPGREGGFPLDFLTPVRHVATQLDRVAPATLSLGDLALGYTHHNPGDLSRLRDHFALTSDLEATSFLIRQAVLTLANESKHVIEEDGGYRLAVPFEKLRFERKRLHRIEEEAPTWPGGSQPFNRLYGKYSDQIRSFDDSDLADLRESMKAWGWLPYHPAIVDEHDVILVGRRRLKVAAELGIDVREGHEFHVIPFGDGDMADAKRLAYALASNMGIKELEPWERKDFAEYFYGERKWETPRIIEALKVSKQMIRKLTRRRAQEAPRDLTADQKRFVLDNFKDFGGSMGIVDVAKAIGEFSPTRNGGYTWPLQKFLLNERAKRAA